MINCHFPSAVADVLVMPMMIIITDSLRWDLCGSPGRPNNNVFPGKQVDFHNFHSLTNILSLLLCIATTGSNSSNFYYVYNTWECYFSNCTKDYTGGWLELTVN